ncbi:MAG: endonuclease/exonuclease/phosphatase family protein [Kiritimatiellae bacterium]|nr:endonuclease/exonuclease/phosphatase family protein [Kiritimatiellia bacterium]
MKKVGGLFTCSALALMAFAALPLSAAELAHRWSFNGDWADSVGGADAVKCGTYVSLYGGRVHMGYGACSHGTGYVDLGTNMLDTAAATIEIWARHDGVKNWARVFDYGADDKHYFTLAWTGGTDFARDRAGAKNPGETATDDTMAPYELGVDYHISVTFRQQGDGSTFIRWQRRDAATGECQKFGTMTMPDGIQKIVDPVLYLGHSQYTADRDALAAYDEVRVWRGVLTDAQLEASAAAGPDAAIAVTDGAPQFTPAEPPDPPAQRAAVPNGGFRMMTYNIQYCYDEVSTIIPDRTAARIIAENPDFCCVNEVRDSAAHPEATMLAKLTGMHKTHSHNLLLSREEPIRTESYDLPYASYGDRGLLICEFSNVVVAVTHLDVGAAAFEARTNSIEIIKNAFAKYASGGKPVLLGGDWNFKPDAVEMSKMKEFMTILTPTEGVRTYQNHKTTGGYVIDYIAVDTAHADDLYVANSFVVEDIVTSDHNPVIAELYCRPAASTLGWIDESFLTTGRTGAWSPAVAWDSGSWTAELAGKNVFTPGSASGGNVVTMTVTASFSAVPDEEATPDETAQGAVWLGTNGCFQIWTRGKLGVGSGGVGELGWVDVEAEGVMPQVGVEYTFRFVFDYTAGTYSVAVQDGGEWRALAATGGASAFSLAASGTGISRIVFAGEGALRSILGEYVAVEGFSAEEAVVLKDNAQKILSAAEAEWLNKCAGGKTSVAGKIAAVSLAEFDTAHLLNLDITDDERSYTFEITDISVGKDVVTVEVELVRQGAIAQTIYGSLRFYGAATLEAFKSSATLLGNLELSNENFGEGETATATIQIDGETPPAFFEARIEVKSEK